MSYVREQGAGLRVVDEMPLATVGFSLMTFVFIHNHI